MQDVHTVRKFSDSFISLNPNIKEKYSLLLLTFLLMQEEAVHISKVKDFF